MSSEAPIHIRPTWPYVGLIFVVLLVYTFWAVDTAQYTLVTLNANPQRWTLGITGLIALLSTSIFIPTLLIRRQTEYRESQWQTAELELEFDEFRQLIKDYAKQYRHLIQRTDMMALAMAVLAAFLLVGLPFVVNMAVSITFVVLPPVIGGLLLVYGLCLEEFLYKIIPTSASREFTYWSPLRLRGAIRTLIRVPAVTHIRIRMTVGRAGEYYAIRSCVVTGRVRGIESVGVVEVYSDHLGRPIRARYILHARESRPLRGREITLREARPQEQLRGLLIEMVTQYCQNTDDKTLLVDTLTELGVTEERIAEILHTTDTDAEVATPDEAGED